MMRCVGLDRVQHQVVAIALRVYQQSLARAQETISSQLDADIAPVREVIGVPPGVRVNIETGPDGLLMMAWDEPESAAAEAAVSCDPASGGPAERHEP